MAGFPVVCWNSSFLFPSSTKKRNKARSVGNGSAGLEDMSL